HTPSPPRWRGAGMGVGVRLAFAGIMPALSTTALGLLQMLRTCSRVIALSAMVAASSMTVQAADATLRLSCEGMVTVTDKVTVTDNAKMEADAKPEPVIANVIVDFTDRTVQGLFYLQSSLDYQL